jgi:hypothetical protein
VGVLWVCLIGWAAGYTNALAEFALLRPVRDITLIEDPSGALANGSGPAVFSGRISSPTRSIRRALVAFDVASAVPAGSTVSRVTLWLNLSATNAGPVQVRLHRVVAEWGEGASSSSGGGGAPSTAGDSTWIHRFYDDVLWVAPGGDFDPIPRGAALVDQPGAYAWEPTPEMVADVQSWLDHPETGHGWILLGDETRPTTVKRFDSREHPDEPNRPLLEIDYVPPCAPDPAGPGYWRGRCSALPGAHDAPGRTSGGPVTVEPGFAEWILPCAHRTLSDLGLPAIDACAALLSDPPLDRGVRAARKLSVLVLNVCAGRLQTSCPVVPADGNCVSTNVGDLLRELSDAIRAGDCRRASGCAGIIE